MYWLPRMQDNAYNLISFQSGALHGAERLTIDPAPDSVLRVFMAWKPLERRGRSNRRALRRSRARGSRSSSGAARRYEKHPHP